MLALQKFSEEIERFIEAQHLLHAEDLLGESSLAVQAALSRVVQLLVSSLTELAGKTSGRELLWNTVQGTTSATLANPPASADNNTVLPADAGLLKLVLDDRYHGAVHEIVTKTGMKPGAVTNLLDVATLGALGVMKQLVADHNWNAQQLGAWLRPHQPIGVGSDPQVAPIAAMLTPPSIPETLASGKVAEPWLSKGTHKLLVALSIIAAAEFGYIMNLKLADQPEEVVATQIDSGLPTPSASNDYTVQPVSNVVAAAPPMTAVTSSNLAVPVVLKLKNGLKQINAANSTETKLYEFLIDPSMEVDLTDPSKGWIGFDRIYFESNKAILTNESLWQLSNVASILKRFPASKIKIGGYTDSSGNPLRNLQLSKERAEAAMSSLVSLGVPSDHIVAVGYGALDNIATNDTEEGRALNRRVSMQVIQK